jgi:DNA-directed RNA polymerase subunit RPC12/RpoP
MKKKCLSCGVQFALSGSGKRQKYCPKCARRGMVPGRGLPGSKLLKTKAAKIASEAELGSFELRKVLSASLPPKAIGYEFACPIARIERGGRSIGGSTSRS